jgi:hypothetical protein
MFKPAAVRPPPPPVASDRFSDPVRDLEALASLHAEARQRAVQLRREAMDLAWHTTGQALRRCALSLLGGVQRWAAASKRRLQTPDPARIPDHPTP